MTDLRDPQPIDAHTVFRLASLSKSFAATMTGILVNDGVLRWDSHLTDYVPSFQLSQPGAAQEVTAVSYTHLDVYKRQVFLQAIGRRCAPLRLQLRQARIHKARLQRADALHQRWMGGKQAGKTNPVAK